VARGANPRVVGNNVYADATFAETPEGDACLALIDAGMLNACSVGFRPLEQTYDSVRGGTTFLRQELLEFSVVPVPANPEALVQRARTLGLSAQVVRKMFGMPMRDDAIVLRLHDEDDDDTIIEWDPAFVAELHRRSGGDPLPDPAARSQHIGGERVDIDPATLRAAIAEAFAQYTRDAVPAMVASELRWRAGKVD
jgi:hypothetical protein